MNKYHSRKSLMFVKLVIGVIIVIGFIVYQGIVEILKYLHP